MDLSPDEINTLIEYLGKSLNNIEIDCLTSIKEIGTSISPYDFNKKFNSKINKSYAYIFRAFNSLESKKLLVKEIVKSNNNTQKSLFYITNLGDVILLGLGVEVGGRDAS